MVNGMRKKKKKRNSKSTVGQAGFLFGDFKKVNIFAGSP